MYLVMRCADFFSRSRKKFFPILWVSIAWLSYDWEDLFCQVMASKTKIYIVLEYVTGGELFDKIVSTFCSNLALNHPAFVSFSWPCTVSS
jgi:hypothetical protein